MEGNDFIPFYNHNEFINPKLTMKEAKKMIKDITGNLVVITLMKVFFGMKQK